MKNKNITIILFLFAFVNIFFLNRFNQSGNEEAIKWQLIIMAVALVVLLIYKLTEWRKK